MSKHSFTLTTTEQDPQDRIHELEIALAKIAQEATREVANLSGSARRGDASKLQTFAFIREIADRALARGGR